MGGGVYLVGVIGVWEACPALGEAGVIRGRGRGRGGTDYRGEVSEGVVGVGGGRGGELCIFLNVTDHTHRLP